jgi:signal recognition particle receptor subunit beta
MVQINFALKEVNCKVVYYGPGLSGKTTNLEVVHAKAPNTHVGELTSIATEGDRTLFFDFLPLSLGQVAGMNTKFQIYTVPGQVYYNSTRKLVLQGADGIVFVADSRRGKMDENLESLSNLEENLREYGMDLKNIPFVLQYNKRDLPDIYTVEELQEKMNRYDAPHFEAVAVSGEGVFPTLKKLSSMVLEGLNRQQSSTVVRKPAREPVPETVSVGAGGAGKAAKAPAVTGAGRPGSGRFSPSPRRVPAKPETVDEKVMESGGVKPIQRRVAPSPPARTPSPQMSVALKKRPAVQVPKAQPAEPKRKGFPTVLVVTIVLVALAGAAVYFTGIWNQIMP